MVSNVHAVRRGCLTWAIRLICFSAAAGFLLAQGLPWWLPSVSGALTPVRVEVDGPLWKRPLTLTLHPAQSWGTVRLTISGFLPMIRLEDIRLALDDDLEHPVVEAGAAAITWPVPWRTPAVRQITVGSLLLAADRMGEVSPKPDGSFPAFKYPEVHAEQINAWIERFGRYLPASFQLHSISFRGNSPAGVISMDGLSASVQREIQTSRPLIRISIADRGAGIHWQDQHFPVSVSGTLTIQGETDSARCAANWKAGAGTGATGGSLELHWDRLGLHMLQLGMDQSRLEGPAWAALAQILSAGLVRCDAIYLEPVALEFRRQDAQLNIVSASGAIAASGLRAGPADDPWFSGDAALEFAAAPGRASFARLQIEDAGTAEIKVVSSGEESRIQVNLAGISPDGLARCVPGLGGWLTPWQGWLPERSDLRLEGTVKLQGWTPESAQAEGTLTATWPEPGRAVNCSLTAALDRERIDLRARAEGGGGSVNIPRQRTGPAPQAILRVESVDLGRWLKSIRGWSTLDPLSGTWAGEMKLFLGVPALEWNVFNDTELQWQGRAVAASGAARSSGRIFRDENKWLVSGTARLSDGVQFRIDEAKWLGGTHLAGRWKITAADFRVLAETVGQESLWGELSMPEWGRFDAEYGRIAWESGHIDIPALGWGALFLPPDWTVKAETGGEVYWGGPGGVRLSLGPTRIEMDQTLITLDRFSVTPMELFISGLQLNTNLVPLVRWGWIGGVQHGDMSLNVEFLKWPFTAAQRNWEVNAEYQAAADRLLWRGDSITLESPQMSGNLIYGPNGGFSGSGELNATALRFYGGVMEDLSGRIAAKESTIAVEELAAKGWNGTLGGRIECTPLSPGWPVRGSVRLRSIDLARLCDEIRPPYARFEGILNGWSRFAFRGMQPTDFRFRAMSGERFSVNTDFVRQLLLRDSMSDYTGGRQAASVLLDVLGPAAQRPFDSGAVDLRLVDGRLAGTMHLASGNLNITVDIQADPLAIRDALEAAGNRDEPAEN